MFHNKNNHEIIVKRALNTSRLSSRPLALTASMRFAPVANNATSQHPTGRTAARPVGSTTVAGSDQ